jgi:hypothetical protein
MASERTEIAIEKIVAACDGGMRGALEALLLVNEHLEAELHQPYAAISCAPHKSPDSLPGRAVRRERWNAHVQIARNEWRKASAIEIDRLAVEREIQALIRLVIFLRIISMCSGVFVAAELMELRLALLAR